MTLEQMRKRAEAILVHRPDDERIGTHSPGRLCHDRCSNLVLANDVLALLDVVEAALSLHATREGVLAHIALCPASRGSESDCTCAWGRLRIELANLTEREGT